MRATISYEANVSRASEIIRLEIMGKLDYLLWDDLLAVKQQVMECAKKTLTEKTNEQADDERERASKKAPVLKN